LFEYRIDRLRILKRSFVNEKLHKYIDNTVILKVIIPANTCFKAVNGEKLSDIEKLQ